MQSGSAGERYFSAAWNLSTWLRSTMTQERFSNLKVLNSQKERTAKFALPPHQYHFKRGGHRPPYFKNCSEGPPLLRVSVLGLQPRDKVAMPCWCSIQWAIFGSINMKMVFSSHRRETLSFLITTVATVTSRVNQQYSYYSGDPREARSVARGRSPIAKEMW